jgi:NADP-dependent 3-hydroxy acid dehydrogenase YdfG
MHVDKMKIVITGHTRGLGKSFLEVFAKNGHTVVGFSTSTGVDISNNEHRNTVLASLEDADVFINNAYDSTGQTLLLEKSIELWDKKDKFIINIGSKCTTAFFNEIKNPFVKTFIDKYSEEKLKQEQLMRTRLTQSSPRLLNISAGVINTEMAALLDSPKMNPDQIAELVYYIVSLKGSVLVQELTIDHPSSNWSDIKFLI